jgi:hypothetical protein
MTKWDLRELEESTYEEKEEQYFDELERARDINKETGVM